MSHHTIWPFPHHCHLQFAHIWDLLISICFSMLFVYVECLETRFLWTGTLKWVELDLHRQHYSDLNCNKTIVWIRHDHVNRDFSLTSTWIRSGPEQSLMIPITFTLCSKHVNNFTIDVWVDISQHFATTSSCWLFGVSVQNKIQTKVKNKFHFWDKAETGMKFAILTGQNMMKALDPLARLSELKADVNDAKTWDHSFFPIMTNMCILGNVMCNVILICFVFL